MSAATAAVAPDAIAYRGVRMSFGAQEVLTGVDLAVRPGTVTFVVGASGAGKSVLGRLAVGLLRPTAGEVTVEGVRVDGAPAATVAEIRKGCAMVLQGGTLLDWLSLEGNVALPLCERHRISRRDALERAKAHLAAVGIESLAGRFPPEVGPGVRKRTSIARALALEPHTVIYDEPTTGLDPRAARRVDRLIRSASDGGRTALVVSHDLESVRGIADRVAFLCDGRIRFLGTAAELDACDDPAVVAFLGRT